MIREKIALHDWLLNARSRTRLTNPPGFLAKAVACDLPLPDDYKAHLRREAQRKNQGNRSKSQSARNQLRHQVRISQRNQLTDATPFSIRFQPMSKPAWKHKPSMRPGRFI